MAAQNLSVRLQRSDSSTPWGFRLQGGLDFSTPLSIQRVNPGSLSDQTGLQAGDAILRIGNENAAGVKHKDAQDMIVRCGNYLEMTVQRGAVKIWKPSVTPVNELRGGPVQNIDYGGQDPHLFKTSLAADKQDFQPIGSSHNIKPKPFITGGSPASGPSPGTVKAVVHAQYNSPVGLYSSSNIADTLATQTQGLIQGIQGINVSGDNQTPVQSAVLQAVQQEEYTGADLPSGMRKVAAPVTQPGGPSPATGGQPLCGGCGRLIIGVFVRVNNKPLHAECFTCATCGTSLKNIGYFTINEKLYCETHARQLTKPPGPNYEPVSQFNKPQQQQQQQQPWKQPAPPAPAPAPAPPAPSAGPARQPGSSKFQWPPPKPCPDSDDENDQAVEIAGGQPAIPYEQNEPKPVIQATPVPKPATPTPSQVGSKFPTPISSPAAPQIPITSITPGTKLGPKPFVATNAPFEPSLPSPLAPKPTIPTGPKPFVPTYQSTPPTVVPKPGPPLPSKPATLATSPVPPPLAPKPTTPIAEVAPTQLVEPITPQEEESSIVIESLVTPSKAVWPPPKPGSQSTTSSSSQGLPVSKSLAQWPPPKPTEEDSVESDYQNIFKSQPSPPSPQIPSTTPVYNPQSSIPTSAPNTLQRTGGSPLPPPTSVPFSCQRPAGSPLPTSIPGSFQKPAGSPLPPPITSVPSSFQRPVGPSVPSQGTGTPGINSAPSAFLPMTLSSLPRCSYNSRPVMPPPPVPSQQSQSPQPSKYPQNTHLTFTPIAPQPTTRLPSPVVATAPPSPTVNENIIVSQSKISLQTTTSKTSVSASPIPTTIPITASSTPTNPSQNIKSFGAQYGPPSTKGKGAGAPNWMSTGIPQSSNANNVPWSMSAS